MTDCTERHPPRRGNGVAGEGQKGMTKEAPVMTDCTERHPPSRANGVAGEGQKGMTKEAQS
jgi:hypothetical protein